MKHNPDLLFYDGQSQPSQAGKLQINLRESGTPESTSRLLSSRMSTARPRTSKSKTLFVSQHVQGDGGGLAIGINQFLNQGTQDQKHNAAIIVKTQSQIEQPTLVHQQPLQTEIQSPLKVKKSNAAHQSQGNLKQQKTFTFTKASKMNNFLITDDCEDEDYYNDEKEDKKRIFPQQAFYFKGSPHLKTAATMTQQQNDPSSTISNNCCEVSTQRNAGGVSIFGRINTATSRISQDKYGEGQAGNERSSNYFTRLPTQPQAGEDNKKQEATAQKMTTTTLTTPTQGQRNISSAMPFKTPIQIIKEREARHLAQKQGKYAKKIFKYYISELKKLRAINEELDGKMEPQIHNLLHHHQQAAIEIKVIVEKYLIELQSLLQSPTINKQTSSFSNYAGTSLTQEDQRGSTPVHNKSFSYQQIDIISQKILQNIILFSNKARNPYMTLYCQLVQIKILIALRLNVDAIRAIKQCRRLAKIYHEHLFTMKCFKQLTKSYLSLQKLYMAQEAATKYLQAAWMVNSKQNELQAYELMGQIYFYQGDTFKSNYYHERMVNGICEPSDSHIKLLNVKSITGMQNELQRISEQKGNMINQGGDDQAQASSRANNAFQQQIKKKVKDVNIQQDIKDFADIGLNATFFCSSDDELYGRMNIIPEPEDREIVLRHNSQQQQVDIFKSVQKQQIQNFALRKVNYFDKVDDRIIKQERDKANKQIRPPPELTREELLKSKPIIPLYKRVDLGPMKKKMYFNHMSLNRAHMNYLKSQKIKNVNQDHLNFVSGQCNNQDNGARSQKNKQNIANQTQKADIKYIRHILGKFLINISNFLVLKEQNEAAEQEQMALKKDIASYLLKRPTSSTSFQPQHH